MALHLLLLDADVMAPLKKIAHLLTLRLARITTMPHGMPLLHYAAFHGVCSTTLQWQVYHEVPNIFQYYSAIKLFLQILCQALQHDAGLGETLLQLNIIAYLGLLGDFLIGQANSELAMLAIDARTSPDLLCTITMRCPVSWYETDREGRLIMKHYAK